MNNEENNCERPKTNLEIIIDFCRYFLRWLAKNKIYGTLLFLGIMAAIALIGYNITITWNN